jgi:hypothetical protein
MVNFGNGTLENQFFGNYGMLEIYVNVLAGLFLLVSSLATITVSLSYGRSIKNEITPDRVINWSWRYQTS